MKTSVLKGNFEVDLLIPEDTSLDPILKNPQRTKKHRL
jgi:hypothetical protein